MEISRAIKAIAEFDWTNQRVLVRTKEDGQDRIEWVEMREVYVNPQALNAALTGERTEGK